LPIDRVEERLVGAGNDAAIGEGEALKTMSWLFASLSGCGPDGGLGGTALAAAFDAWRLAGRLLWACAAVGIKKGPNSSARRFTPPPAAPPLSPGTERHQHREEGRQGHEIGEGAHQNDGGQAEARGHDPAPRSPIHREALLATPLHASHG